MSQNQLTLPDSPTRQVLDPSTPEGVIVERFVEDIRTIAPTVEISLAKRIIRPGSNQVLCLAAHTSVPLNEDELASVSDLALRLSDGTNVRLSLSFFNDQGLGCIPVSPPQLIPMTRSSYDPDRYEIRDESKLGLVLFATTIIAVSVLSSMLNGPLNISNWRPGLQALIDRTAKPAAHTIAINPGATVPRSAILPADASGKAAINKTPAKTEPKPKAKSVQQETGAKGESSRRTRVSHARAEHLFVPPPPPMLPETANGKNFFVPPPPPTTYSFQPGVGLLPVDPLQGLAPAQAKAHSANKDSAKAKDDHAKAKDDAKGTSTVDMKDAPAKNASRAKDDRSLSPSGTEDNANSIPTAENKEGIVKSSSAAADTPHITGVGVKEYGSAAESHASAGAPIPGADSDPPLERIVLPN